MTQTDDALAFVRDMAMRALSAEHDADEKWLLAHDVLTFHRDCDITKAREINARADLATQPDPLADPRVTALEEALRKIKKAHDKTYHVHRGGCWRDTANLIDAALALIEKDATT